MKHLQTLKQNLLNFKHQAIIKLQILYGSRCKCGGLMVDVYEEIGWARMECDECHKTVKY